ncbi:hypothetical protein G9A89_013415 [Geosiphon pyriformis]|nr:hypothetical protein G9A89_013415 [Geosiphon pyriformis]
MVRYGIAFVEQLHFGTEHLDILEFSEFGLIYNWLLDFETDSLSIYMDGSLKGLESVNMRAGAAVFFEDISLDLGVRVSGLMSFTLAELQAIALAFKCVLPNSSVGVYLDSQAVLDVCKSELGIVYLDFRNCCWVEHWHIVNIIRKKDLSVSWHKMQGHLGVMNNKHTDALVNTVFFSPWCLVLHVKKHYILADGNVVSGSKVLDSSLHSDVDWFSLSLVWHPDLHIAAGFINDSAHCHLLDAYVATWGLLSGLSVFFSSVS